DAGGEVASKHRMPDQGETPLTQPTSAPRPRERPVRIRRWSTIERAVRAEFGPLVAGVDEVGRGPLAGPVVACAVIMPPDARAIARVDDSKVLTAAQRARLAPRI